MRVLAVNPPFLPKYSRESRSPAVAKSGTLYYPMWLAYAVGHLEQSGHEVLFLDAPAADMEMEQVCERAARFGPRMAVLDTSTPSIYSDAEVASELKRIIPGLFVVLVGVHVSAVPEQTLRESPAVDVVACGEYDATINELAETLTGEKPALKSVSGIVFRDGNGEICKNAPRPHIEDLDALPFVSKVYKSHLDIRPYFYGHSRHPLVVIVTGRGCPFRCTFCVTPQTMHGHKYRRRSVANVVAEFRYIAENFPQAKEIMIEDDTLTADRQRCRDLAQALIEAKMTRIPWSANSRADVDFETIRLMKRAGCRLFCVGFESGDQRILDNIRKGTKLEKIRAFVKDAKRAGVLVHGCFMVGNRGETVGTLEKTLALAKELSPDTAQFFPIMVYPGTSDYAYFEEKNWITTRNYRDWLTKEGLHSSVVSNPDLTYEQLVAFCDRARREFYLRPSYVVSKIFQVLRHPGEARRVLKASRTLAKHLLFGSVRTRGSDGAAAGQ